MTEKMKEQMQRIADAVDAADRLLGSRYPEPPTMTDALRAQAHIQIAASILELTFGFVGSED